MKQNLCRSVFKNGHTTQAQVTAIWAAFINQAEKAKPLLCKSHAAVPFGIGKDGVS